VVAHEQELKAVRRDSEEHGRGCRQYAEIFQLPNITDSTPLALQTQSDRRRQESNTAYFHVWWKTTRISESYDNIMRETASQLQRFLTLNKSPGIFLYMRQEAL
jgi:hypothetical protein